MLFLSFSAIFNEVKNVKNHIDQSQIPTIFRQMYDSSFTYYGQWPELTPFCSHET